MSTDHPPEDSQDPAGEGGDQPDPRELLQQLRTIPADEIVADLFSTLLNTAQVKLGRRDARLFIDLSALLLDYARPHVADQLGAQVAAALGQLRLAQVSAETEVAAQATPEVNDLDRMPTPPTATGGG